MKTLVHEDIDKLFEDPNQPREVFGLAKLALLESPSSSGSNRRSRHLRTAS
jgi:hypothetical protein